MSRPRLLAPRAIEKQLRELVRFVVPGARVYFGQQLDRRVRYSWNGRHLRPSGLTLESQCHEVAHLIVSTPARRKLPEFGLGPDPYRYSDARRVIADEVSDREERDACAMQMVLVRVLGLDEAAVNGEVREGHLTPEALRALHRRYRRALPSAWWKRVLRPETLDAAAP